MLMRKLFLLLACLFSVAIYAGHISEQEALQKARQFMHDKQFATTGVDNTHRAASASQPETNSGYYIFNAENNSGFVIVSADDRMPEILGYSNHGSIDIETAPCGLKWLLGCYDQMAKVVSEQDVQLSHRANRADKAPVAPFITTTWGQSTPYNALCPRIDGARAVTGCVATAMAQIMNYYRWPNQTTVPIPEYTTFTNKILMPQLEPTTFTWGHLNKDQLSKLMLYCGQSVKMDYGPDASGAGIIDEALKTYFGYNENLRFVGRDDYSDELWNNMLYEEIAEQRPVYYCGYDGMEGHAFVLCGFNDDHFYINWGWDGAADGYYILDGISPSIGAYNLGQGGVIGIKPNGTPTPITYYPRQIVMEDKAWTSVGLEGRYVIGIETIKRLTEDYPDNFIAIETHVSDPMEGAENYTYMIQRYGGSPCCYINRNTYMSPYYEDIKPIVELLKDKAFAKVEATAVYAKPDKSAITVKSETTFGFNGTDEDFRLAFVLLEDKVGPYIQDNSLYSNPSAPDNPDDWLNYWVHQGTQVEMLFDNVARGIYGDAQGMRGSLPSTVEKDKCYQYEYTFNVPTEKDFSGTGWVINPFNSDNFRVVALLIDKSTGEIINACQTNILFDESVKQLSFEFMNNGKKVPSGETLSWKSKGKAEDNLKLGTNLKSDGLKLCTFDGKQASGTATLEILTNTLGTSDLTWGMGGNTITMTGSSQDISFTTGSTGNLDVQFTANDIRQFGELDAKLTATINGASQSVNIKFVHKQADAQYGRGIELAEGQSWWNNAIVNFDESPVGYMQGTGREERYSAATYIPAHLFGNTIPTIDGISFFGSTTGLENIEVWISTHLPAEGEKPDIATYSFPDEEFLLEKFNDVVFHQAHEIPGEGVYVGYSFDVVEMNTFRSATPVMFSEKTRDNALWFKTESKPKWIDRFDDLQGNLQLRILFGNGVIKKNAVGIKTIEPVFALTNTTHRLLFELANEGSNHVNSLDLEIEGGINLIGVPDMIPGYYQYYEMNVNTGSVAEFQNRKLTITKVNGVPNESEYKSAIIPFYISDKNEDSKVVLEEFTGTWCGYTPAANLALAAYQEEFGDQLIIINAHHGRTNDEDPRLNAVDPMELSDYEELYSLSGGRYPSCTLNRIPRWGNEYSYYPLYEGEGQGTFNLNVNIAKILAKPMPAAIEVGAEWTDDNKNAINIYTRTTFELNASELPLQIGYVLLEDGLSGEGEEWAQANFYSGIESIEDRALKELTKLPALITGQEYNNVAVAAWGPYKGVDGSLVGPYAVGKSIEGSYTADITGNQHIQNKDNLSVVALLVNKEDGTIINAAKCKIGDTLPPTDITSVRTTTNAYDVYDLQGRQLRHAATSLDGLPHGIYIANGRKFVSK